MLEHRSIALYKRGNHLQHDRLAESVRAVDDRDSISVGQGDSMIEDPEKTVDFDSGELHNCNLRSSIR